MNQSLLEQYCVLLKKIYGSKLTADQAKNITVFNAIKGIDKECELMVIGRATNGWGVYFNPKNEFKTETKNVFNKFSEFKDLLTLVSGWKNKDGKGYNFNRSAFWRVSKRVAKSITKINADEALNSTCYTNLYKISPDGLNPSKESIRLQLEDSIAILAAEIEYYKPKRVLFLTGYNWARPFIEKFQVEQINPTIQGLNYQGTYKGIEVIVADHPQGKDEDKIVKAIRTAWGITSAHINR